MSVGTRVWPKEVGPPPRLHYERATRGGGGERQQLRRREGAQSPPRREGLRVTADTEGAERTVELDDGGGRWDDGEDDEKGEEGEKGREGTTGSGA